MEIGLRDFGDASPVIALKFLLDVRDGETELRAREDILLQIIECAERLGVTFAPATGAVRSTPSPP